MQDLFGDLLRVGAVRSDYVAFHIMYLYTPPGAGTDAVRPLRRAELFHELVHLLETGYQSIVDQ